MANVTVRLNNLFDDSWNFVNCGSDNLSCDDWSFSNYSGFRHTLCSWSLGLGLGWGCFLSRGLGRSLLGCSSLTSLLLDSLSCCGLFSGGNFFAILCTFSLFLFGTFLTSKGGLFLSFWRCLGRLFGLRLWLGHSGQLCLVLDHLFLVAALINLRLLPVWCFLFIVELTPLL